MNNLCSGFGVGWGTPAWMSAFALILPILVLWSIFWKGLALWHSGRRGNAWWFVILLVVNTMGILEIVYLFGVLKLKLSQLFSKESVF
ncbi:MAG: DUF5652 family protein [Candidatus Colwellbacteria bacterium]|nr:DUF5652 family protein [Candidatus Colwellbacteria bacterium]